MKHILVVLITILGVSTSIAQKKNLTLQQHNEWKSFKKFELTPDGSHLVYEVTPLVGDHFVVVQNMADLSSDTIQRASGFKLDSESQYVAFYIKPLHDSLRAMKLREVKKKDLPKDSLGIWLFGADSMQIIPDIKSFELSGEGTTWLSYSIEKYKAPKQEEPKKKKKKKKKEKSKPKAAKPPKTKQGATTLYDPITLAKTEFPYATGAAFAKEGVAFAVVNYRNNNWDSAWVQTITSADTFQTQINASDVSNLTWDNLGNQLAYLASADTSDDVRNYSLNLLANQSTRLLADSSSTFKYSDFGPSSNGDVYFSKNGEQLYFGIAPLAKEEPKDSLLKDEKAMVDVWHYQDLRIQPEQLKQVKRDEKRTFLSVYYTNTDNLVQLADSTLEKVYVSAKHNNEWAVAYNRNPYSIQRTWEYPWRADLWWINIQDGARIKLLQNIRYGAGISAHGRYAHWYESTDQNWYALRIGTTDTVNLTQSLTAQGYIFYDEMEETPSAPYPLGMEGWTTNDEFVFIKSKHAIWQIDPTGKQAPKDITNGLGKAQELYLFMEQFDEDFLSFNLDSNIFISAQSAATNDNYYFMWSNDGLEELYSGAFNLRLPMKAKNVNQFTFRKESYADYPNIWWLPKGKLTTAAFQQTKQITDINAQQQQYRWGSVEKYSWTDGKGNPAKGLLYKPENFDSTEAYPMVIYFYEKLFETEHNHRTPRPSYSTISIPFYVSNEYIVFVPDIHYVTGHPAQDAYNSIVSGAESLAAKPWVDGKRMGIQGQSWGGYQVAALVTQTNLFAAAMAGAPVSNMTSAYGGIRWGSGLSRMFQYEKTQSRIGGTLWDARDLYLENSPVFHLDKVTTPLLIMHNDNDGAVPWYQGIELYMGMRRLQKPAWMLVYNKEEHNLRKLPNRKDLSRRMFEFFNHYLKDEPMPKWMDAGIPAVNKKENESYGQ